MLSSRLNERDLIQTAASRFAAWSAMEDSDVALGPTQWRDASQMSPHHAEETRDMSLVSRLMKYWRSGVQDVCAQQARPFVLLDAVNAGLFWSGLLGQSHSLRDRARSNFVHSLHAGLREGGPLKIDPEQLGRLRARAIFALLPDRAASAFERKAGHKFASRLMDIADLTRMKKDPDFVPPRVVIEAIRVGRTYFAFSDDAFGDFAPLQPSAHSSRDDDVAADPDGII